MEFTTNVANLGKYDAGVLAAVRLSFPATTEPVQAVLREIGVDGLWYEETINLEYSISVKGLAAKLEYIFNNRTPFREIYDGRHIPEKYKVFRYPLKAKVRPAHPGKGRPSRKRP